MLALMSLLVLRLRRCHVDTSLLHLVALSVVLHTWMLETLHISYTLATYVKFVDTAG